MIGRWHFTRLRLARPEIDLVRLKDGGLNVLGLIPPPAAEGARKNGKAASATVDKAAAPVAKEPVEPAVAAAQAQKAAGRPVEAQEWMIAAANCALTTQPGPAYEIAPLPTKPSSIPTLALSVAGAG